MSIIIIRTYTVACDEPNCDEWSDEMVPEFTEPHKAREVRKVAANLGWTRRGTRDYCPEHSTSVPDPASPSLTG